MKRLYKFSDFLKDYFLTGFVNSFTNNVEQVWQPFTEYALGSVVTNTFESNGKRTKSKYVSISGYKSGNQAPIHTSKGQIESDGGIRWIYIGNSTIIDNGMFDMYLTLGRVDSWDGTDNPVTPYIDQYETKQCISDIIYAKKIDKSSIAMVAKRNKWVANTTYDEYKRGKNKSDKNYYVTNKEGCLYYCLSNNNKQPSTIEPTSESTQPIYSIDGYVWYFIAKIDIQNSKYVTDEFIPLTGDISFNKDMKNNKGGIATVIPVSPQHGQFSNKANIEIEIQGDGSDAELNPIINNQGILQYFEIVNSGHDYRDDNTLIIVKEKTASVTGTGAKLQAKLGLDPNTGNTYIESVEVLDGGSGYQQGKVSIHIEGDGTGAELEAVVSNSRGNISNVTVVKNGTGYNWANLYVVSGENSLVAKVSLLPYSVSNPNILSTLQDNAIMINMDLNPSQSFFNYDSYYREVLLVVNLLEKDTLQPADKNEYIGKGHRDWTDSSSKLPKIDDTEGMILFRQTSNKLLRVEGQYEKIKLIISL